MYIAVIGSINTDLIIQVPRFAKKNETILVAGLCSDLFATGVVSTGDASS